MYDPNAGVAPGWSEKVEEMIDKSVTEEIEDNSMDMENEDLMINDCFEKAPESAPEETQDVNAEPQRVIPRMPNRAERRRYAKEMQKKNTKKRMMLQQREGR